MGINIEQWVKIMGNSGKNNKSIIDSGLPTIMEISAFILKYPSLLACVLALTPDKPSYLP